MSETEDVIPAKKNRLGDCEVCAKTAAKYTCPECEVKSCSVQCVKIHKAELDCDGVRSRTKFKRIHKLSNLDILSDYRLLEETSRAIEAAKKDNIKQFSEERKVFNNQRKGFALMEGARRKEVGLKLLPPSFTERKNNTTKYFRENNEFFWRVKWVFRAAENVEIVEERVSDTQVLGDVLSKYMNPQFWKDSQTKWKTTCFHNRELHRVEVLLPVQGVPGKKFFLLNVRETIAENLKYKNVVEYPTFHVILEEDISNHHIVHIVAKNKNLLEYNDEDAPMEDN